MAATAPAFRKMPTAYIRHCAIRRNGREIVGFFRDHYLSDLVGFVYSRMGAAAAAEDLHQRFAHIGERVQTGRPLTVSIILDGENAWEYFPGNGREFLKQFYRRIESDPDIHALTASEADRRGRRNSRGSNKSCRARGSTRISIFGLAMGRLGARGRCCAKRAKRMTRAVRNSNEGGDDASDQEKLAAAYEATARRGRQRLVLVVRPGAQHLQRRGI